VEESYLLVEEDYHRVETVVPPVKPTDVVETLPEPPWVGEPYRAEEIRPQPQKRRIFPRFERVVPPMEPAEVAETLLELPSAGEQHHGEEKGQRPKELRIFPTAVPGEIERKLAELYQRRLWERSGFAPKAGGTGDPQPSGKERANLTELSERNFRASLSSGWKPS
jgi:hypothetical protein